MSPPPVLTTPRLTLRPLRAQDAPAVVAGVGDYDVAKWLSVVPYPYALSDAHEFIDAVVEGDKPVWGVEVDDALIGTVSVDDELGYWIARSAWRRGYGFEAAHAAISHWFSDPDMGDLRSAWLHGNTRSGAVLTALGFVETSIGRRHARALSQEVDSHEMCLTRAAWENRQRFEVFTPRLTLRPLTEADAPAMLGICTPRITRGTASIGNDWSPRQMADFIAKRRWRGLPGFMLGIERDGALIGAIGCGGAPVSLFYLLAEAEWGQGLVTEAVSAFLPEIFMRFPLTTLTADHFKDTPASGAILRKHGFVRTGTGTGTSLGRLDPAPVVEYRVDRDSFRIAR